jgi:hypothetical protein
LLAQKVLAGRTRGYRRHPQLARFRAQEDPVAVIVSFLVVIADEASNRGYRFDAARISRLRFAGQLEETSGQLLYEWRHLKAKLRLRAPAWGRRFQRIRKPEAHPIFSVVPGEVREWEKR